MKADYFCDLLDFAMPRKGGYAVLLNVYIDASKRPGGIFCVSGFAFGTDRAKKASAEWRRLWGDTICHMTDLHSRQKAFAQGWDDRDKVETYLKNSIAIVNRYRSYGVAVSCDLNEINALAPISAATDSQRYLAGFRRAYPICCHLAMSTFGKLVREHGGGDHDIAYFFETGDADQAESQQFIAMGATEPILRRYWSLATNTLIDKADARLLEPSDILAWEWAKHRERVRQGKGKRPPLRDLLGDGIEDEKSFSSGAMRAMHLQGDSLKNYFENVRTMILASDDVALPLLRDYLARRGITLP